jgi:signal transduction histidine kinase
MKTRSKVSLRNPVYRPLWQIVAVIVVAFFVATSMLVISVWRTLDRMQPIHHHIEYLTELQQLDLGLQSIRNDGDRANAAKWMEIKTAIARLTQPDYAARALVSESMQRLQQAHLLIQGSMTLPGADDLENLRNNIRSVTADEVRAHNTLINALDHDTRFELELAISVWLLLSLSFLIGIYLLRKRLLLPLDNLSKFMSLLGKRDYQTMSLKGVDDLLQPLFSNYNNMVNRLEELEAEHKTRQLVLEERVRDSSRILLEQHLTLARSERLAAVGEFAAALAHELRNPLAGIELALTNLQQELKDSSHRQRAQLITSEIERVVSILNTVLDQSRHAPEQMTDVDVAELLRNMVNLLKLQIPSNISLHIVGEGQGYLPVDGLRQVMINIILNAAQAIGDKPGNIVIHIKQLQNNLALQVCDSGPGFPADILKRPTQPFSTSKENGTGLGLAMVRRFVRNMNGELRLENDETGGACVSIFLPCEQRVAEYE